MKLSVATICSHVWSQGRWWSYEPFILEMNLWSDLFDQLVMVAPVELGPPPPMWAPYAQSAAVSVIPFRANQGRGLLQPKTSPLELWPMMRALAAAARQTDALQVRCPGNIGLVGALLAPLLSKRLVAKYAGQWPNTPTDAWSYRLQKAILRSRWWRGPVLVYGSWPNQPRHIVPFFTSVLSEAQMKRAALSATQPRNFGSLKILFAGRLSRAKNVSALLRALALLKSNPLPFTCTVLGDGPQRIPLEKEAARLDLNASLQFKGALPFAQVLSEYESANVLVLVSETEGWPKAIAEAMAFGLVCVGANRGLVPQMLADQRGFPLQPGDPIALAETLRWIASQPEAAARISARAAAWARQFTLESFRAAIRQVLQQHWDCSLRPLPSDHHDASIPATHDLSARH